MSSKVSFRARALDANKALLVCRARDLPDLHEYAQCNRHVPIMPTGMEKEEEMELHLQEAINHQSAAAQTATHKDSFVIPTPHVTSSATHYDRVYQSRFELPTNLIKTEVTLSIDPEVCDYDADSDDERWLQSAAARTHNVGANELETIIDRLEKDSQRQVISLKEARALLADADDNVLQTVYDYWVEKRLRVRQQLCPRVRTERRDLPQSAASTSNTSPYIAFRRRAEKMQTRKNRKNDEDGYEKMLHLAHDLRRAAVLLEMLKRREKTKKEQIHLHAEVIDRRHALQDWHAEVFKECSRDAHPSMAFLQPSTSSDGAHSKSQPSSVTKQRRKRKQALQDAESGIASRDWLRQNLDDWNRAGAATPTSPPRPAGQVTRLERSAINAVLDNVDVIASTSTRSELDGKYVFKRRRGCTYHAPMLTASSSNGNVSANNSGSMNTNISATSSISAMQQSTQANSLARAQAQRDSAMAFHRTYLYARPDKNAESKAPASVDEQKPAVPPPRMLAYAGLCRRRVARGRRILLDRRPTVQEADWSLQLPADATGMFYRPSTAPAPPSTSRSGNATPMLSSALMNDDSNDAGLVMPSSAGHSTAKVSSEDIAFVREALPSCAQYLMAPPPDSGYSSPASARSRSAQRSALPMAPSGAHVELKPFTGSTPYMLVRGANGSNVCAVPITVGISPALYSRHADNVGTLWPLRQSSSTDSPPGEPVKDMVNVREPIDKVRVHETCAAVQSASFLATLQQRNMSASSAASSTPSTPAANAQHPVQLPNGTPAAPQHVVLATGHAHHPLPTPSPSPNDDRQTAPASGGGLSAQAESASTQEDAATNNVVVALTAADEVTSRGTDVPAAGAAKPPPDAQSPPQEPCADAPAPASILSAATRFARQNGDVVTTLENNNTNKQRTEHHHSANAAVR